MRKRSREQNPESVLLCQAGRGAEAVRRVKGSDNGGRWRHRRLLQSERSGRTLEVLGKGVEVQQYALRAHLQCCAPREPGQAGAQASVAV